MSPNKSRLFKLGTWLLSRMIHRQKHYGLFGDMEEIYTLQVAEKGLLKADLWFWLQVIKIIPACLFNSLYWSTVMFKNYLKITFRSFKRQKAYSIINVAGLAVGLACCVCILVYVHYELSYDKFHAHADNIYRLVMNGDTSGSPFDVALSSGPIGPTLAKDFPEVDNVVRFQPRSRTPVSYMEKKFLEGGVFYADETVFDVFRFALLKGNPETALKNPFSAVITQETARRYFGSENPLGKILRFNGQEEYAVTGVMDNVPGNSHFAFDFLLSYKTILAVNRSQAESWTQFINYTYLLLREGANPHEIEIKITPLNTAHMGFNPADIGWNLIFTLQPLKSIHLHSNLQGEIKGNGDIAYVYIFSSIAFLILLLACINFMNLATTRSSNRAKEVGLRKVLGALRGKLIKQFLGESLIYSFLSLLLALILAKFALPLLSSLAGHPLEVHITEIPWLVPGIVGIALFVGLTAGIYPAVVLAGFQPAKVIKGGLESAHQRSFFRNVLVVIQLAISTFLIIGTGIILKQTTFMKNKRLGFDKERVIVLQVIDSSVRQSISAVKLELKRIPGVINVTASSHIPGWDGLAASHLPEGFSMENTQIMRAICVDSDFLDTMGIELVSGRNFSPEFPSDNHESVLINEAAVNEFGWDHPLGKKIQQIYGNKQTRTVIGVVKDFHMSSLHSPIEPMFINGSFPEINAISVRIAPGNISRELDSIRSAWKKVVPDAAFDYFFLDESFDKQYRVEERLSRLFSSFSMLAIFIACLGLFGMACYSAEKRTKEIGIRKMLGASASGIVLMLNRELIRLFLIANAVTWPIVYLASQKWLQNFAYRTNLGIGVFILSAILILVITLGAVSYQAIKAAVANPVESLRYE
jgi:putative ABC transport system permease protein